MLKILLPIFLASLVVACGTSDENAGAANSEKVRHVYNWADYIGEATIRDFEARTGSRSSTTSTTRPRCSTPSC